MRALPHRKAGQAFLFLRLPGPLPLVAGLAALLVVMPVMALVVMAFSGDTQSLMHVAGTTAPHATVTTLILLAGIAAATGITGAATAWLVSFFAFPGRRIFAWALMLPLAVPTYISAYAFTDFFTFTGPVQGLVRRLGGFELARDYWFPDIRSLWGAVLVFSTVLYPYVYLAMRGLFLMQGRRAIEAAAILGAGHFRTLRQVLLPLARPALALGIILALMETLNDIGATEYLGIRTLTYSVFSTWVNQSDLAGSAQIALILLLVVTALIFAERWARRGQRFAEVGQGSAHAPFQHIRLTGPAAAGAVLACLAPVALGFGVPFIIMAGHALRYAGRGIDAGLIEALSTSVGFAAAAAVVTALVALLLSYAVRVSGTKTMQGLVRIASVGYAMPGTIIALGIFLPLARLDNLIDAAAGSLWGISTGLLITGSGATLVYAYAVRFMAIAEGSIDGGLRKLSPSLDMAALSYGRNRLQILLEVLLPLMRPALATAALLVFIDSLKELSATLLLRPFGVETLAIYAHDLASRGRIEQASGAAVIIVIAGIVPVIILTATALGDRKI